MSGTKGGVTWSLKTRWRFRSRNAARSAAGGSALRFPFRSPRLPTLGRYAAAVSLKGQWICKMGMNRRLRSTTTESRVAGDQANRCVAKRYACSNRLMTSQSLCKHHQSSYLSCILDNLTAQSICGKLHAPYLALYRINSWFKRTGP